MGRITLQYEIMITYRFWNYIIIARYRLLQYRVILHPNIATSDRIVSTNMAKMCSLDFTTIQLFHPNIR